MPEVKNLGPLDWRIAITDTGGRPTPEFQRRWNEQRANNDLISVVTLGSGAPPGAPIPLDSAVYIDTSVDPYVYYIGFNGIWHQVGAKFFTDLADAPSTYVGAADNLVQVNAAATGLEFTTLASLAANPTATAKDTAVNGTALTFMRSDAAPLVQKASSSQFGIVKVDGTTITESGGVISSSGGGGGGSVAWNVVGSYSNAVSGNVANVDSSDLSTYNELYVQFDSVNSSAARVVLLLSIDGSTYYNTNGNYGDVDAGGSTGSNRALFGNTTSASAVRSSYFHIKDLRTATPVRFVHLPMRGILQAFLGSTSPIIKVRAISTDATGAPSGNITAGKITMLAR